ncbi:MAG: 4Fe-4S binding protein [Eubacteriales bacterium]|nr:4Fe-4S binding protein [Eubacteriales bacterium]
MKKRWYDYLWIWSIVYFSLGFFNILFAWLGMIDFLLPLGISIFLGNKKFCNSFCGRGQLFSKLGTDCKCSLNVSAPKWLSKRWFRLSFLAFFLTMFGNMIFQTYLVASGAQSLREAIKLFWTFKVPFGWTYAQGTVIDWVAQFSFGFYSLMLTSTLIGLIVMIFYKPRTWCTFCPMGTMTQEICKLKSASSKEVENTMSNEF